MSFETTTDEVLEGVDLHGKVAIVTGASTGLGLETARALASVGAHVVLAGRDAGRIEAAAATIRERVPDAELEHGDARPHVARPACAASPTGTRAPTTGCTC